MGITVEPARVEWMEALVEGDDVFTARFGIPVAEGWAGFPEAVPVALEGARAHDRNPWGTHLVFDDEDGALVGFGGFQGAPQGGAVELGYAVAPGRQGRGIATAFTLDLLRRARAAGVELVLAHTLAEANASTAVLQRCGFAKVATLTDPATGVDDEVWRWERPLP